MHALVNRFHASIAEEPEAWGVDTTLVDPFFAGCLQLKTRGWAGKVTSLVRDTFNGSTIRGAAFAPVPAKPELPGAWTVFHETKPDGSTTPYSLTAPGTYVSPASIQRGDAVDVILRVSRLSTPGNVHTARKAYLQLEAVKVYRRPGAPTAVPSAIAEKTRLAAYASAKIDRF